MLKMNKDYTSRKLNTLLKTMLFDENKPEDEVKDFVLRLFIGGDIKRKQIPLWFWRELTEDDISEERKNFLLEDIRKIGFPNYEYDKKEYAKLFKRLKDLDIKKIEEIGEDGSRNILLKYAMFTKLASVFFPYMIETPVIKMKSPMDAWYSDKLLIRTIKKCFQYASDFPNFGNMSSLIKMVSGVQCVSNFKPEVAKYIYEKYNKDKSNVNIFDFSMGYGGRMVGALSADNVNEYVGVDVNSKNFKQYKELYDTYKPQSNINNVITFEIPVEEFDIDSDIELENKMNGETYNINNFENHFDIVFSSPPYFTKELYSDDPNQSCNKFGSSLDAWIDGFLKKVIENMYKITKPGGYFIINIADIKINGKIHDLETVTKEHSEKCGFTFVETVKMKMGKTFGTIKRDKDGNIINKEKFEPIFVFKK
jgi:SAM-dependent methyltransferase